MNEIDFERYSTKDLLQALENVDDQKYPDNALKIYLLVLKRLNLQATPNTYKELGYEDGMHDEIVYTLSNFLIGPTASMLLFGDTIELNSRLEEKIARLNKRRREW